MKNKLTPDTISLYEAILSLSSVDECAEFFEDVSWKPDAERLEIQDITQRFAVAKMLDAGDKYQEIEEKTGASTATISRVNKCLLYGSGGYRSVLKKTR